MNILSFLGDIIAGAVLVLFFLITLEDYSKRQPSKDVAVGSIVLAAMYLWALWKLGVFS